MPSEREEPVVVWGDGAADRLYPPDPYMVFVVVLGDGTALDVAVTLAYPDGALGDTTG